MRQRLDFLLIACVIFLLAFLTACATDPGTGERRIDTQRLLEGVRATEGLLKLFHEPATAVRFRASPARDVRPRVWESDRLFLLNSEIVAL